MCFSHLRDVSLTPSHFAGTDSGGHGTAFYGGGLPTTSLIPLLAPHFPPSDRPVLLAAGGISTGSQLLSTLALGASGAIMGTRFLASTESLYSSGHKDVVIKAKGEDTVRTMKFDWARGTVGWDKGVDGRGVSNLTSEEEWKEEDGKLKYDQAMKDADMDRIVVWAGAFPWSSSATDNDPTHHSLLLHQVLLSEA